MACTSSSPAGTTCASVGGKCVLGGASCTTQAALVAQDCNPPPQNPGGAFCCAEVADAHAPSPVDSGARDAAVHGDAATSSSCPATAPTAGAACTTTGIACGDVDPSSSLGQYGSSDCAVECTYGDDVRFACRPDFACIGGAWTVQEPMPEHTCTTPPPASCPATLKAAGNADCPVVGAVCAYGPSACVCNQCTGGCPATADGGIRVTWECDEPPSTPGCPAAAPNYGTACGAKVVTCDYGNCYAGTWMEAKCVGGLWRRTDNACTI